MIELTFTTQNGVARWSVLDVVAIPSFVDAITRTPEFAQLRDTQGIEPPDISDVVQHRVEVGGSDSTPGRMEWETSAEYEDGWPHQWKQREAVIHGYDLACERNGSIERENDGSS